MKQVLSDLKRRYEYLNSLGAIKDGTQLCGIARTLEGVIKLMEGADVCTCQNCGKKYSVDVMVSDEDWDKINPIPNRKEAGLLCAKCIGARLEATTQYAAYKLVRI
jgi:hypothetical protein